MVTDRSAVAAPWPICGARYPASRHRVQSDIAEHGGQLAIVNHLHRIKAGAEEVPRGFVALVEPPCVRTERIPASTGKVARGGLDNKVDVIVHKPLQRP